MDIALERVLQVVRYPGEGVKSPGVSLGDLGREIGPQPGYYLFCNSDAMLHHDVQRDVGVLLALGIPKSVPGEVVRVELAAEL